MIKVVPFIYEDLDDLYANTYVLIDSLKQCVVIDPAKANQSIVNYIKKNNLQIKAVLLTHGHIDHMRGTDEIINSFHCPLYIGFFDADKLTDAYGNCSMLLGQEMTIKAKASTLSDKEVLNLLEEDIQVIETPFHTSGSVCYYLKNNGLLFTGDFLFAGSIGRSDLPSAMSRELKRSMSKILALPKETKVFPGHGKTTTLEIELDSNPFVK